MPTEVNPNYVKVQQVEVDVNGPDDINKMFIINGQAQINLSAQTSATNQNVTREETFKIKLDPKIKNKEFRRSIANAQLDTISLYDKEDTDPNARESLNWSVTDVDADYDDESGQVELRVSAYVRANGESTSVTVQRIGFSVTTLASMTAH